ncbi:hypothetical protein PWT90_02691 [Aphanocladium album]|nr:hypothetical protein PWT90_02691 [Aphanocladium album]
MLPEPALTLTIPSVHDGLPLDCRIYHPASLRAISRAPPWKKHAAVLAHPYAPLGGSYDDPVVEIVGAKILEQGYLLATFNFRGAGHSAGKTSWTSKAERYDFQSLIAFLAYYIHHLEPFKNAIEGAVEEDERPTSAALDEVMDEKSIDQPERSNVLLIGGYSYGSLITAQLPPLETILEPFASPPSGSNEAQIRLRAASLAEQQNTLIRLTRQALREISSKGRSAERGVRVGGSEGYTSPRRSVDGRRSISRELDEKLHELLAKARSNLAEKRPLRHQKSVSAGTLPNVPEEHDKGNGGGGDDDDDDDDDGNGPLAVKKQRKPGPAEGRLPRLEDFAPPQPAYLLMSPIPGLASHLVTMKLLPNALSRARRPEEDPAEAKLVLNPTLAVYGDGDMFVLPYKAREWVARLSGAEESKFQGVEVSTAGHFWAEEGVLEKLLQLVEDFVHGLALNEEDVADGALEVEESMDQD